MFGVPNQVDVVVVVAEAVAQTADIILPDPGTKLVCLLAEFGGCLAQNEQRMIHGVGGLIIGRESGEVHSAREALDSFEWDR
jgi:hypothetical protein